MHSHGGSWLPIFFRAPAQLAVANPIKSTDGVIGSFNGDRILHRLAVIHGARETEINRLPNTNRRIGQWHHGNGRLTGRLGRREANSSGVAFYISCFDGVTAVVTQDLVGFPGLPIVGKHGFHLIADLIKHGDGLQLVFTGDLYRHGGINIGGAILHAYRRRSLQILAFCCRRMLRFRTGIRAGRKA